MVLDPVCVSVYDIMCVCVNNKNESETKQESQAQGATFDSRLWRLQVPQVVEINVATQREEQLHLP